jgi:ADP-L-glycero-D-manno-heptose 6-epimerase
MESLKILVTGGGGFIGRNLTERLIRDGHQVTITSTGSEPNSNAHKVLYMSLEGIDFKYIAGQDVVFHQMANNDTRCFDFEEMYRANIKGPIKLFNVALEGGCKKFIYASSTAVYGDQPAPYTEDTKIAPLVPYASSKALFDSYAMKFAKENQVSVTGLRYCNVYGPGESNKGKRMSMIGQIIRNILAEEPVTLFKDGNQKRDWVYVKDVVEANILAMQHNNTDIYNIGSGGSWSFNEVFEIVSQCIADKNIFPINFIDCPFLEDYQSYTECSIEKAGKELGYKPKYDLKSGIQEYISSM